MQVIQDNKLTPYPPGSTRELWVVCWPMMLASLSGCLMIFVDRIILARYSADAFVASTATQPWYWTISFTLMGFITITEVFVGQFNGSQQYSKIGQVVGQMVCLAFAFECLLIPLAKWAPLLLASNVEGLGGTAYLRILLCFMPFELAGFGAIGSFFVGRGETKWIPFVLLFENLMNVVLDIWFIFGGAFIPPLGIQGAAYATGFSQVFGFVAFLVLFLRPRYRRRYAIDRLSWSTDLLKRCLKIGGPNALSALINISGWAIAYQMLALKVPRLHLIAYSIAHTVYILCYFVIEGMAKGVGALSSNFIGAKKFDLIETTLKKAIRLSAIFTLVCFFFMVVFPEPIIQLFADKSFASDESFLLQTKKFLFWSWILFFFESVWFSIQSFLIALAKTRSVMLINVLCFWGISLCPTYWLVGKWGVNSICFLQLIVLDHSIRLFLFWTWYRKRTWMQSVPIF